MHTSMSVKSDAKLKSGQRSFILILACLTAVLGVLFFNSFRPGYVHFSNDGPLGSQIASPFKLPEAFSGVWNDLNWLGVNGGTFLIDITSLTKFVLGPVGFAKFLPPVAIFLVGLCSW